MALRQYTISGNEVCTLNVVAPAAPYQFLTYWLVQSWVPWLVPIRFPPFGSKVVEPVT